MSTFGSFGTLITPMCRKCNIIMAKRASTAKQVSDMMHLRGQDSELIYHDRDISIKEECFKCSPRDFAHREQ